MLARSRIAGMLVALALAAAGTAASAIPVVLYDVTDLGGGLFQYDLTLDNSGGLEPLAGLNVLHGDTVFGLDDGSTISAPSGWIYLAPVPSLLDDLNYISLGSGTDVTPDESLGGFSFVSATDPDTLTGDDFHVEGIGADSASQIDLGTAVLVPEPATAGLVLGGLWGLAGLAARERRRVA